MLFNDTHVASGLAGLHTIGFNVLPRKCRVGTASLIACRLRMCRFPAAMSEVRGTAILHVVSSILSEAVEVLKADS